MSLTILSRLAALSRSAASPPLAFFPPPLLHGALPPSRHHHRRRPPRRPASAFAQHSLPAAHPTVAWPATSPPLVASAAAAKPRASVRGGILPRCDGGGELTGSSNVGTATAAATATATATSTAAAAASAASFSSPSASVADASLPPRQVELYNLLHLGPLPYAPVLALQRRLVDDRVRDAAAPDALVLVEHAPVYTLGRASDIGHVLFDAPVRDATRRGGRGGFTSGGAAAAAAAVPSAAEWGAAAAIYHPPPPPPPPAEVVRTERGGEVTYHGPGQVVAYPIFRLSAPPHTRDLHVYVRNLEEVVLAAATEWGIAGGRKDGLSGVWVGDAKLAAVGVKVSRWVTCHGVAVNVDVDLSGFQRIVPCGIVHHGVTSVAKVLAAMGEAGAGRAEGVLVPPLAEVGAALLRGFDVVFGVGAYTPMDVPPELAATPATEGEGKTGGV